MCLAEASNWASASGISRLVLLWWGDSNQRDRGLKVKRDTEAQPGDNM